MDNNVVVIVTGTVLSLCAAVFVIAFSLKSIEGPHGVLTPKQNTPFVIPFPV